MNIRNKQLHPIVLLVCTILTLINYQASANSGDISTVAGGGIPIVTDNQKATRFSSGTNDIVFDDTGNYYYSDSSNHFIYKVDPQGHLSIFAGTGEPEYTGDNGLAIKTGIPYPSALAFDTNQNLHVADANNCIRKISSTGIISTILCGGGTYSSDNFENVFAFDSSNNLFYITSQFDINYTTNYFVKKRDPTTNIVTTVAGFAAPNFSDPYNTSYNFNLSGPATTISLSQITDIHIDSDNNLFFSESGGRNLIRRVDNLGMLTTIAGNGTNGYTHDGGQTGVLATSTGLSSPTGVLVDDSGHILITDSGNHQVRKVDTQGIITTVAGSGIGFPRKSGDGEPATEAKLYNPTSVAIAPSGEILITDTDNYSIRMVDSAGNISTVAGTGSPSFTGDEGLATASQLYQPSDVVIDAAGNIYIADSSNHRIRKITPAGIISTIAGTGTPGYNGDNILASNAMLNAPTYLALDSAGNLFISDYYNNRIRKIDSQNIITSVAGNGTQDYNEDDSGIAIDTPIGMPGDIAVDPDGNLYVIDNSRILKVTPSGNFTRFAGNGYPGYSGDNGLAINAELRPSSLATDTNGNLFIGVDNYIRKVSTDGIITTIAGNGFVGSSGDNGPATSAELSRPDGLGIDKAGNIYFSDYHQGNIRKIDSQGIISRMDNTGLNNPKGLTINSLGDIYVAEVGTNLVRKVEGNPPQITPLYRLYLPSRGTHLYTKSEVEYNTLASAGWIQENIAFKAYDNAAVIENQTSTAWLRLYNPNTKRHHWTTSRTEYDFLGAIGWLQEGATAYIFENQISSSTALYRLYNPHNGAHHWTLDTFEKNFLLSLGWLDEGVAGYVYNN